MKSLTQLLLISATLLLTRGVADAFVGGPLNPPTPTFCITGQTCFETCLPDGNGGETCQQICLLEIEPCEDIDHGGEMCMEGGDDDNLPDECPEGTLPPPRR